MTIATVTIDVTHPIGQLDHRVFGHFLESNFFGNIEGGVFDEGSARSKAGSGAAAGLRTDVVQLCRRLGLPVVRWPGGNFTSAYHWTDGIGPRDSRPRRLDLTWGGEESNRFGTDEFLAWCAEVGTEPFLVHSARDVDDAVRWVEYTNYGGDTELTRQRAANGHPDPYRVRYWGVGNEVYGDWQMGHRSAERYAADAREHVQFMRAVDPELNFVGAGTNEPDWIRPLLRATAGSLDFVSLHLYGASTHLYADETLSGVADQAVYFERELRSFATLLTDIAAEVGLDRPPAIAMDEWNVRHLEPVSWPEPAPGDDGGIAPRPEPGNAGKQLRVNRWSPRTLADALCYAGVFHALFRLCGHPAAPRMANTVNLVNANGLIVARPNGALPAATYGVWELYQNHLGRTVVPVEVAGPMRAVAVRQGDNRLDVGFATRTESVPDLDVVATIDDGVVALAAINRAEEVDLDVTVRRADGQPLPRTVQSWTLGAGEDDLFAANSLHAPDRVGVVDGGTVAVGDDGLRFPAHSVTVVRFPTG